MCGNGGLCVERRMPASSGDPVSTALHMSLAGNKCATLKNDDLDNKIVASARRVLLTEVQYEPSGSYSSAMLDSLKSKYIVLNANICDGKVDLKVKNGPKESASKDSSPKKVKSEVTLPTPKRILYPPEAVQLGWQSSSPIGSGMINMGNTCYLNSTLQALFHVPAFVNWILNDKIHSAKCGIINGTVHTECLICTVMKTLQFSQRNSGTPIKPLQIYSKLKLICKHLVHGHQEDAHEFLRYLIESMERSYLTIVQGTKLDSYSKETTPLNQIFGGYLRTEVTCLECRHVSTTFQHFQDLLLDIRTVGSVEDALDAYFGREQLGEGEEAYRCEQCHRRVAATKKFSIQKAPNVLCMQLKRFGIFGGKISKHVSLKQKLDLSRFMHPSSSSNGELSYKLVSMISHIGPSASCGHYTAMAASSNGFFYLFDDSMVRQVQLQTVLGTNAYVIMYELEPSSSAQRSMTKPSSSVSSNTNNGVISSSLQNGVTVSQSSPISVYKPSLILSSSKAERASASSSSSSSTSTSSLSTPSSSSVTSSSPHLNSPKQSKILNGLSSPSKSLVPYTPNESSDSESENATGYRSTKQLNLQSNSSKELKNSIVTSVNGVTKEVMKKSQSLLSSSNKISPSKESSSSALRLNFIPSSTLSSSIASSPCKSSSMVKKEKSTTVSSPLAQPSSKKPSDEPPTLIMNGWHVSESSLNSPNGSAGSSSGSSTSIGCSVGQWSITEITKSRSCEKSETITTETKLSTQTVREVTPEGSNVCSTNNSSSNDNNNNNNNSNNNNNNNNNSISSCSSISSLSGNSGTRDWSGSSVNGNSNKMWDGNRNSETVNELLKMSHRGYGTPSVNSWNGGKSEVEKEVDNDKQEQRKRSHHNLYDEELDRGKVKKVKNYAYSSKSDSCNSNGRRYNPFQEHQNRKNSWHGSSSNGSSSSNSNSSSNSKRHLFYRNFNNIDRYRNNHQNYAKQQKPYHHQNGYNRWRH
ncbi:ubiquitin specific peptidase 36 isoform X1 [Lycorma delicatula]|uniref:ubiquitin specific peptidase 36 isoform X1 n=1 Tax=Lycorma delicatula TaxID=130591 RepID=UPI003F51AAB0